MTLLALHLTDFLTSEQISEIEEKKERGVYALCPFFKPYYVGIATPSTKSKYWVGERVKAHIEKISKEKCDYIVFTEAFYKADYPERSKMIPRKAQPTKPVDQFFKYADKHALFWRVNDPRFFQNNRFVKTTCTVGNIVGAERQIIRNVVDKAFSDENFRVFFLQSPLLDSKEILKCIETIIKFSLKHNTVSESYCIHEIASLLEFFGISKINIHCPNEGIRNLFYSSPHDENHNPVANLQGIVNITLK